LFVSSSLNDFRSEQVKEMFDDRSKDVSLLTHNRYSSDWQK